MFLILCLIAIFPRIASGAETRDRVVIVDTGVSSTFDKSYICKDGNMDFTNSGTINDTHGHGTNIASIIAKEMNPSKLCITSLKFYGDRRPGIDNLISVVKALLYTRTLNNVVFINLSLSGIDKSEPEEKALRFLAEKRNVKISVAAGNNGQNLTEICNIYPACYDIKKNFYVIGNKGNVNSNYGGPVLIQEDGNKVCAGGSCLTGTSQAAALFTARLIKKDRENVKTQECIHDFRTDRAVCY